MSRISGTSLNQCPALCSSRSYVSTILLPRPRKIRQRRAAVNLWTRKFYSVKRFQQDNKNRFGPVPGLDIVTVRSLTTRQTKTIPWKETHNGPIAKGWRSICADSLRSLGQPDRAVNQGLVMVLGCVDWRGNSACCLKPVWCLAIMHASSINKHNEWSSRVQRSGSCSSSGRIDEVAHAPSSTWRRIIKTTPIQWSRADQGFCDFVCIQMMMSTNQQHGTRFAAEGGGVCEGRWVEIKKKGWRYLDCRIIICCGWKEAF